MRQQSLATSGFERFRKKTRKELFLEKMDQIIPWPELTAAIEPFIQRQMVLDAGHLALIGCYGSIFAALVSIIRSWRRRRLK